MLPVDAVGDQPRAEALQDEHGGVLAGDVGEHPGHGQPADLRLGTAAVVGLQHGGDQVVGGVRLGLPPSADTHLREVRFGDGGLAVEAVRGYRVEAEAAVLSGEGLVAVPGDLGVAHGVVEELGGDRSAEGLGRDVELAVNHAEQLGEGLE